MLKIVSNRFGGPTLLSYFVSLYTRNSRGVNYFLAGFFALSTASSTQAIPSLEKRQGGRFTGDYGVGVERLELSIPKATRLKLGVYAFHHTPISKN